MNTRADKTRGNKNHPLINAVSRNVSAGEITCRFVENQPQAIAQRKLQEMAINSARVSHLEAIQDMAHNSPRSKQAARLQAIPDKGRNTVKSDKSYAGRDPAKSGSLNGDPSIQRKVMIDGEPYRARPSSTSAMSQAIDDEYVRYYESEQEALDHIDKKVPGPIGLIKPRALWYRVPYLSREFFVFGESHAGVRGARVKEASNITMPILDEQRAEWSVGEKLGASGEDAGLDEKSSKLLRALEIWCSVIDGMLHPRPPSNTSPAGKKSSDIPKIPVGESSTRDEEHGTYRLVVYDQQGKEEYWKPSDATEAPKSTYGGMKEVYAALSLFEDVFAKELKELDFDNFRDGDEVLNAWLAFNRGGWVDKDLNKNSKISWKKILEGSNYLKSAAEEKVSSQFRMMEGAVDKSAERADWKGDDYRNEFIFLRILEARKQGSYAFATVGNKHLEDFEARFKEIGMPFILMKDFFGRYSTNAVDTKKIAHANSPVFRKNQRLVLWLQGAFREYPNLQQFHLDMLTDKDFGEFVLKGTVAKWESGEVEASGKESNKPVLNQFFTDLRKIYPNGDHLISGLTHEEIGEFITTEKISSWDAM